MCWCVLLMPLILNGVTTFLYCALPIWSCRLCFIKQLLLKTFCTGLYVCISYLHCIETFPVVGFESAFQPAARLHYGWCPETSQYIYSRIWWPKISRLERKREKKESIFFIVHKILLLSVQYLQKKGKVLVRFIKAALALARSLLSISFLLCCCVVVVRRS